MWLPGPGQLLLNRRLSEEAVAGGGPTTVDMTGVLATAIATGNNPTKLIVTVFPVPGIARGVQLFRLLELG